MIDVELLKKTMVDISAISKEYQDYPTWPNLTIDQIEEAERHIAAFENAYAFLKVLLEETRR